MTSRHSRRADLHLVDRRGFLTSAAALAAACTRNPVDATESEPFFMSVAGARSASFLVEISGPKSLLLQGSTATITGRVRDLGKRAYANRTIGLENGMGALSTVVTTDRNGYFSLKSGVLYAGISVVTVVVNGERYPFLFQSGRRIGSVTEADSIHFKALALKNPTKAIRQVKLTGPNGERWSTTIAPGKTKTVLRRQSQTMPRVTAYTGVKASAGVMSVTASIDSSGTETMTLTGGELLLRFKVFANRQGELNYCWAPGVDLVVLAAEVEVCVGDAGFHVTPGAQIGSPYGYFAGVSLQVI